MRDYRQAVQTVQAVGFIALAFCVAGTGTARAVDILQEFPGASLYDTRALGTGAIPPDMGGAVSPNYVTQFVNGAFSVYSRTGTLAAPLETDGSFWQSAGIDPTLLAHRVSDPRIIYDPTTQRFFASQVTIEDNQNNHILVARSNDSNPLDGFKAVSLPSQAGQFGDFPTLGITNKAVTVGVDNFSGIGTANEQFNNVSLYSIPKSDLVGTTPTAANATEFDLDASKYGFALQAATNFSGNQTNVVAISAVNFNEFNRSTVTNTGGPGASISPGTVFTSAFDGITPAARQPSGIGVDAGGDNISSGVSQVGNLIYLSNTVSDSQSVPGSSDMVHWAIYDTITNKILVEGLISDPNVDYYYPSIQANASGDFVISFNGSGPNQNISGYADICHYDGVTVTCGGPELLIQGLVGNYRNPLSPTTRNRWGDYSWLTLDPTDPRLFWAFLEYPLLNSPTNGAGRWGTEIIEIFVPEPSSALIFATGLGALIRGKRRQQNHLGVPTA